MNDKTLNMVTKPELENFLLKELSEKYRRIWVDCSRLAVQVITFPLKGNVYDIITIHKKQEKISIKYLKSILC